MNTKGINVPRWQRSRSTVSIALFAAAAGVLVGWILAGPLGVEPWLAVVLAAGYSFLVAGIVRLGLVLERQAKEDAAARPV